MPDISMCKNSDCPSHRCCYRFTAKPNEHWQPYGGFAPAMGEDACIDFMSIMFEDDFKKIFGVGG